MDFLKEVIQDAKKSLELMKRTENANVEPLINMIEDLARTKTLRILDIWLDVLGEEIKNNNVSKLYERIKEIRFVEMEDKDFLEVKNVFTEDNTLLYSGYDDWEAWNVVRNHHHLHPDIRIEYWKKGKLTSTRYAQKKNQ